MSMVYKHSECQTLPRLSGSTPDSNCNALINKVDTYSKTGAYTYSEAYDDLLISLNVTTEHLANIECTS